MSSMEGRKSSFKKTLDAASGAKKRMGGAATLRKAAWAERVTKRRMRVDMSDTTLQEKLLNLERFVGLLESEDIAYQFEGCVEIRKLLSTENNPPIDKVISSHAVPRLVFLLDTTMDPKLQFEAAWALTNIASGDEHHTKLVIDSGAVPVFIKLLHSPHNQVKEQSTWALGNIAGDSVECRDYLLSQDILTPLLTELSSGSYSTGFVRNASWCLSNLCRGKPSPVLDAIQPAFSVLAQLIYSRDEEVLTDVCWAFSYISENKPDYIEAVLKTGILRRVVELMMNPRASIQTPSLRIVGNTVTGNASQTDTAINCGALAALHSLMNHPKKSIRKETCWAISNITAGQQHQIGSVFDENFVPLLLAQMQAPEFEVKREAAWAIANAASGGRDEQIDYLVQQGSIPQLCGMLDAPDVRLVTVALEGLTHILKAGKRMAAAQGVENRYAFYVEEAGGVDAIELLQNSTSADVSDKAGIMIDDFFSEGDEEVEGVAPDVGASSYALSGPAQGGQFEGFGE